MSSLLAYIFGIVTVLVIFIPFWYISKSNEKIQPVYKDIFCNSIDAAGGANFSNSYVAPVTTTRSRNVGGHNNSTVNGRNASSTQNSSVTGSNN